MYNHELITPAVVESNQQTEELIRLKRRNEELELTVKRRDAVIEMLYKESAQYRRKLTKIGEILND